MFCYNNLNFEEDILSAAIRALFSAFDNERILTDRIFNRKKK